MARRRRQPFWPKVFLALAGVIAFLGVVGQIFAVTSPPPVPGWGLCSFVASLDGAKTLILEENHHVIFEYDKGPKDRNDQDQNRTMDGEWSFDEASKRYAITLNGTTTVYSVVQWDNSNTCLLISGDLNSANLRESWFSQNVEEPYGTRDRD